MSSGVFQNAVPVIKSGRSGRCLGVMRLNGLVRVRQMEATFQRFRGRQGFPAPPACAVLVGCGSVCREWRGFDQGSGERGIYRANR